MSKNIPELFGSMVFNEEVMRTRLPKDVFKAVKKTIQLGTHLELDVANVVATAMKDWAVERGATHFSHWFQPMTSVTAEKHDSFISPIGDGKVIMEFSGKELVKGEPDASSFPSGGIRATFEARGYTVWDVTSYAFIKDGTLCIPTAFCSYTGECLDKKTPLLRSMEALSNAAVRVLKLFGNTTATRVQSTVGPEQEYFLIKKDAYLKRPDLVFSGRTLFGAKPPKGQEMEDHYFGALTPQVSSYMKELDEELWKLGILAKTKHNEVAPAQHELAPIFSTANVATDHNQLTMEMMKSVAIKHGLVCLLHEKPFAGVNGSGKHNNWSMSTNTGINLLEPGDTPNDNAQFLLFLVAVIKAVDDYQDLLRVSVASAGNDHRLGANEAPPAIVAMFLGEELTEILEAIEKGIPYKNKGKTAMDIGVTALPHFNKDTTDRNRTSPFAFTGNKFEFRMPGSSFSISGPNVAINTAVAETLTGFAEILEKAKDFKSTLADLIKKTFANHKRIIFNGDNYSDEWKVEAAKRGLSNLKNTPEAMPAFTSDKAVKVFTKHKVFTKEEIHARGEIDIETYCKTLNIEAQTMISMTKELFIPSAIAYQKEIVSLLNAKKLATGFDYSLETTMLQKIAGLTAQLVIKLQTLEDASAEAKSAGTPAEHVKLYGGKVLTAMKELRAVVDDMECVIARKHWPVPSYSELLFGVNI